jgi:hypothetical protein
MKREFIKISPAYSWKENETLLCCKFDNLGGNILYGGYRGYVSVRNIKNGKVEIRRHPRKRGQS